MNKLLIISGPTATGKTDLAVKIAKKYSGELVSGDSCQIYRGLDIGTGKDHPKNTPIHLVDIINPDQKFSVADFQKIAIKTIQEIQSHDKLPILVGCSGFYIDSVINPNYNTFSVKPNKFLRFILNHFSVKRLQKIYKILDPPAFFKLNHSDVNNHYRLTRKIEIKLFQKNTNKPLLEKDKLDILHISLTAPLSFIYQHIDNRVQKRLDLGFLKEIEKLLEKYKWSDPGMQIAAYQCMRPYFEKDKMIFDNCLQQWKYAEHSDARRQSCWFKSRHNIRFVDITQENYFNNHVLPLINKWYTK